MKNLKSVLAPLAMITLALFCSCQEEAPTSISRDQIFTTKMYDLRLGDGVPVDVALSVRWTIENEKKFLNDFESTKVYDSLILRPRGREIAASISNNYPSIDSLFSVHRNAYITDLKYEFTRKLVEEGISVKEVIVSDIVFPTEFTNAKEKIGLKEQELASIRQQSIVDQERALAAKQKTEADGKVAIAQAQVQGRLEKIQSETEKNRRQIELARAETERQVSEMKARTEAKRRELLAEADLKKEKDLKLLAVDHQRDLQKLEEEKERSMYRVALDKELEQAKLCAENPNYASFLVSRELASKVQIAVLPSDGSGNIFNDILRQSFTQTANSQK